jgi:radical SAM protein with 4Fe4S-binding SPASM domain
MVICNNDNLQFDLKYLFIYLGWKCNLNCKHCWVPKESFEEYDALSDEQLITLLNDLRLLGTKNIKISGGEPFLYKNKIELIINYAKKNDIHVSIETNGTLIDEDFLSTYNYNKLFLSISLDSADPIVHDTMRGSNGSYKKIIAAMDILKKYSVKFNITYSTLDGNESDIDELIKLVKKYDVQSIKINPIMKIGRAEHFRNNGSENSIMTMSSHKILSLYSKYCKKRINGIKISIMVPPAFSGLFFLRESNDTCVDNVCANCPTFNILSVLPNGDIGLCAEAYRSNSLKFGNMKNNSIVDIWNSVELIRFRNIIIHELQGICKNCLVKEICWGGCRAIAMKMYGTINAPSPFCQEMSDSGWFPLSGGGGPCGSVNTLTR